MNSYSFIILKHIQIKSQFGELLMLKFCNFWQGQGVWGKALVLSMACSTGGRINELGTKECIEKHANQRFVHTLVVSQTYAKQLPCQPIHKSLLAWQLPGVQFMYMWTKPKSHPLVILHSQWKHALLWLVIVLVPLSSGWQALSFNWFFFSWLEIAVSSRHDL